jgi:drug/metabolite transporter (DMT)-like permease
MAIFFMLLSSACFVTMSAMVKGLGREFPVEQLVLLHFSLPLPVLATLQV